MRAVYKNRYVDYEIQLGMEAEDCVISSAWYTIADKDLTDKELEELNEQEAERIQQAYWEKLADRSDYLRDLAGDR